MGALSPELTPIVFFERFNGGDAAGAVELYEEDGVFTYDGEERAVGRAQIERALAGFLTAGLKMQGSVITLHIAGDVAFTRVKWELSDANGAVVSTGVSCEVQRRGADGLWRMQLDDATAGSRG